MGTPVTVRVWVTSVWDTILIAADGAWTVARLKETALIGATGKTIDPDDYLVKFRGAEVFDEGRSLADLEVPNGAPMIVLPRRRQPAT